MTLAPAASTLAFRCRESLHSGNCAHSARFSAHQIAPFPSTRSRAPTTGTQAFRFPLETYQGTSPRCRAATGPRSSAALRQMPSISAQLAKRCPAMRWRSASRSRRRARPFFVRALYVAQAEPQWSANVRKPVVELDRGAWPFRDRSPTPGDCRPALPWSRAQVTERGFQTAEQRRLPLVLERLDVTAPRIGARLAATHSRRWSCRTLSTGGCPWG